MAEDPRKRSDRLKATRKAILDQLQPGETVERVEGRQDTFLGLFEYKNEVKFSTHGWYAKLEFTEARGHRTTAKVEMATLLNILRERNQAKG